MIRQQPRLQHKIKFKALFKGQPRLKSTFSRAEHVAHHTMSPLPLCMQPHNSIKTQKKPLNDWMEVGAGGMEISGFVENQTFSRTHKPGGIRRRTHSKQDPFIRLAWQ